MKAHAALAVTLCGLLALLGAALRPDFFAPYDNVLLDAMQRRQALAEHPDPDILLLEIDEDSIRKLGQVYGHWPWPREVHAQLLEALEGAGVRAVVYDVLFLEPDVYRPGGDAWFKEVIDAQDNVFLAMQRLDPSNDRHGLSLAEHARALRLDRDRAPAADARADLALPVVASPERWRVGVVNYLPDVDGTGRRYPLYLDLQGWRLPSLPARVATDLGAELPPQPNIVLNWQGGAQAYPRRSYLELLLELENKGALDPAELAGKIIVVGATATGLGDLRPTPIADLHPGSAILATALDNLLNREWLTRSPPWFAIVLGFPLVLGVGWGFGRQQRALRVFAGLIAISALLVLGSYLLLAQARLLVPVLTPLSVAWAAFFVTGMVTYLEERRRRQAAQTLFGRFLDPRVVKALVDAGETAHSLSGHTRNVTLLFSDIRGFTTLSERTAAETVVRLLNDYFERQVNVIFRHGGTLDKFIGDAIMAFWGAPADDPEHAAHAVAAALDMVDELNAFRAQLGDEYGDFDIGIGIHTGDAVVGFIGAAQRQDYTVIGDTVNLASRIEGLTKGKARILISEATRDACGERFEYIDHGTTHVKGRAQGVRVYEPRRHQT